MPPLPPSGPFIWKFFFSKKNGLTSGLTRGLRQASDVRPTPPDGLTSGGTTKPSVTPPCIRSVQRTTEQLSRLSLPLGSGLSKGLRYISCRNETSITLYKYDHGRQSPRCDDKQNMPAIVCLEVLLQTKPLPTTPWGGLFLHKPCETVQPISRARSAPYTDCQGAEGEGYKGRT